MIYKIKTSLCVVLTLLCFGALSLFSASPAAANIFVADVLGRFLPNIRLRMDPGAYEKIMVLPGNKMESGGMLVMTFSEAQNFYGFSVLICDEKNAELYVTKKKAACFRKEIDQKSDILKYKFKGSETYYAFIVNRTTPLSTKRDISVISYAYAVLSPTAKQFLEDHINGIQKNLEDYFSVKPINYAVVPCRNGVVPTSAKTRTVTVCSELLLGEDITPDPDYIKGAVFYDISPIIEDDWKVDEVKGLNAKLQFMAMMVMLYSEDITSYEKLLNLIENNQEIYPEVLVKYPDHDPTMDRVVYLNKLIDIQNVPYDQIDHWLQMAYSHMNNAILEKIKDNDIRHFGYLRNSARLVLKRRVEQQLEANAPPETEEKNIISDFW